MTQDDVAERIEVDRTTLSRVERGESPYDQDILEKLALAFGCEAEDLLSIDPLAPDPPKLVYEAVRRAPPDKQEEVWRVVQAMLKAS